METSTIFPKVSTLDFGQVESDCTFKATNLFLALFKPRCLN